MDDFENLLYPEITLETDDILMNLTVKKDYSAIENPEDRKKEFIKDLQDFIKEFEDSPESNDFINYYG